MCPKWLKIIYFCPKSPLFELYELISNIYNNLAKPLCTVCPFSISSQNQLA
jgi:hypothetical protein